MSSRPYTVRFESQAAKEIAKLDRPVRRRVLDKVGALGKDPRPSGCVQIKGHAGLWRVKAGDYRVLYTIRDSELLVLVLTVAHRRESYRNL
ncbi:type II toxin-antitoxin system RelE family toxin [Nocardiopsis algeriensis]|uniref:type II toxin-antitoxin system RelE family toxin n=1 Tax=Nocardiopsis algeriensis TaxID=1478215 RepID=UPI003B439789